MRLKITLLLVFTFVSTSWAQRVPINWDGAKIQDYGDTKKNLPNFKNEGFSYSQNNIFIFNKQKVGEKQLRVSNLIWESISLKDLFELDKDLIQDFDISNINYYYSKGERYASIQVGLFKNVKGKVLRLSSFDISESNSSAPLVASKVGTTQNPLSSGGFYKIKVDKSGVFKITTQFLKDNGMNPANINPKNFRIYGNGGVMLPEFNQDAKYSALQENAIQVVGEDDNVWNDGDYALFYAQGPNGYNLYNKTNGNGFKRTETRLNDQSENIKNIYEDFSYYYINFDKGAGKRVQNIDINLPATTLISRFDNYQVINNDQKNLLKVGRVWVEDQGFTTDKTVTFNLGSAIQGTDVIRYRTQVIGWRSQQNSISFNINTQNTHTPLPIPSNNQFSNYDYFPIRYSGTVSNLSGNQLTINYAPNISTNPNGAFYLDYAEIQYKDDLRFNGSQMNFRDFSLASGTNTNYGFSISNTGNLEQVWDVTDITNANRRVNKAAGSGSFNFGYTTSDLNFNNEFVAFRADAAFSPQFVGRIANQNLSALQNVDYLIITTPQMMGQAQRIANYHQTKNNFSVQIVDTDKIYNEFGSGSRDLTAIRDFVTKLNTPLGSLKYVFILGDTSYDYKDRVSGNTNVVSSYQSESSSDFVSSFVTDDYIVMNKPQTATEITNNLPDVPVGRIPAANPTEAANMIDKTLAYYNSLSGQSTPFGEWKMKLDFVVDDDRDGGQPFHNIMDNVLKDIFEIPASNLLKEYNVRKLYLDGFQAQSTAGGQRYPQVNQAISNDIGNSLYLFYFGHGGINGWAQERVLTTTEIQNSNNFTNVYSRFPFVSTITCEFTLWDEPSTFSAGEQFMKLKQGGPATMITSSRALGVGYGIEFTDILTHEMFDLDSDDFKTLGDVHLNAKKTRGPYPDHLKVNLLGDPAMKLSRPVRRLAIDQIETPVPGLIRGLDFVKVKGHINNASGGVDTSFNGRVVINIFDKKINKTTLNNDGGMTPVLSYKEEGSAIVKASGTAVNGVFTVEFYVPKDINYAVGEGRILGYADNKSIDVFNNQPVQVGDINPNGINDNEPPKIKLYMNNTNFANGGITDQNPMLLACLNDDTGINSTGSGVGHDITVYLDGQIINTIVLNDFFSSGEGNGCINPALADYQKGNVTYPFRNLALGQHQLTFKVWDINNNSTTETLNFEVKDEADQHLIINRPLNWPNPFTNKTYVQFEHNCDDILDVNVQIYTITGKLVRTLTNVVVAEPFLQGFRTPRQAIEWDGKDDFGDTVAKGTYIFKIFAKSQNQEKCKGSATAVEKMVLLK